MDEAIAFDALSASDRYQPVLSDWWTGHEQWQQDASRAMAAKLSATNSTAKPPRQPATTGSATHPVPLLHHESVT